MFYFLFPRFHFRFSFGQNLDQQLVSRFSLDTRTKEKQKPEIRFRISQPFIIKCQHNATDMQTKPNSKIMSSSW